MAELLEPSVARQRELLGFPLVDADIAVGANINANKIGTGAVSTTVFNHLIGVNSGIQTQLDGKEPTIGFTPEDSANKGAISGYAGLDASQELLLTNFPSGTGLQFLRRNTGNTALEFATITDLQGVTTINADATAAQIIAAGTGLGLVDAGATHTLSIDATVATLTGAQILTNKTLTTPTIASFVNSTHDHTAGAGGGNLTNTALTSGVFAAITGVGAQSQALDMNTANKIVNLANPTVAQDAATKDYVDTFIQPLKSWKQPVRVASTGSNLTLSGEQTIDGILTSADRILVKDQTLGEDNGIYVTAAGAWSRASDFDANDEVVSATVGVSEGTVNADQQFVCTVDEPITIGTTVLPFVQSSGLGQVTTGTNLSKTANTINFDPTGGVDMLANGFTNVSGLELNNPADTFQYIFVMSAIVADRNVTLPLLISNDTFVFEAHIQTLTNKTLTTPTIASFTNALHDHSNAAGGGNLTNTALTSGIFGAITGLGSQSQDLLMNNNRIVMAGAVIQFDNADQTIGMISDDMTYDVNLTEAHNFRVNNSTEYLFDATQADWLGNNLIGMAILQFNGDTGHEITDSATQLLISTNTGDDILFREVTTELFKINEVEGFVASRRIQGLKGADVTSSTTITLVDGNFFDVTGTTQIDAMTSTDWQAGSVVILHFDASVTVGHNVGADGFFLFGGVDFSATADDTLTVVWNGSRWEETARSVN